MEFNYMQFENRTRRNYFIRMSLGLLPDVVISLVISMFSKDPLQVFLIVFFVLQGLYIFLWLIRTVIDWVYYWIVQKEEVSVVFYEKLIANKFPEPKEIEKSADSYLEAVVNDKNSSVEARLIAMSYLTSLNDLVFKFQDRFRFSEALEDAIIIYKNYLVTEKIKTNSSST
jgi:hypothetical protein